MTQLPVQIRRAELADAPAIHQLHTRSVQTLCRSHYTPTQIAAWIGRRQPAGYLPAIERLVFRENAPQRFNVTLSN
jgi:hypothetical protein